MRWNFAAAACGLWMATLGSGEVFADGDAEAPPSPGRLRKPPATAEVSDRAESPAPSAPHRPHRPRRLRRWWDSRVCRPRDSSRWGQRSPLR
jgi:hypothetical protein